MGVPGRSGRHPGGVRLGRASERSYQTACFQPKGMLLTLSHAWSVGVLLFGCEQALAEPSLLGPVS